MTLKNKTVAVVGGAGFIGSHLVDSIIKESPEKVIVIDNLFLGKRKNLSHAFKNLGKAFSFYKVDAKDIYTMEHIFEKYIVDVVFNLAVVPLPASLVNPEWTFRENVGITITLCEMARASYFDTLIHFSSSETYGSCVTAPMGEDHPLNGTTPYAASKSASDHLIYSYYKTFGISMSIIRPFNNYGPRQNAGSYAGVIPLTINRILNGMPPVIHGDGKQTRDYLYVTDTTDAALKIYNKNSTRGHVINIASGKEIEIGYLIHKIAKLMLWNGDILREPERKGDVRRHIANIYKAKNMIDFSPKVSLEEGLKRTIKWYREA